MERVALPGKAEGGIPGDRKFGVRVSFFNGSNFVNSVYGSFDPDCGSDWQYVSAAAVALVTYSCKILNEGGSLASTLGIQNPFRYRGYVYDQETGLYYLQTRYYDPELGRFISADDLSYLGAGGELPGCNLFAYCGNNPVNKADKTGHDAATLTAGWGSSMWFLTLVDGFLPIGDMVYFGGLGVLTIGTILSADNSNKSKLPNQGPVSEIPDAPSVDAGKQGKHVPGHPNNDETKSQWNEGETGVKETQEAWGNGRVAKPDGSVKVGTASDGRRIKVHKGKNGWIHGYPVPLEK